MSCEEDLGVVKPMIGTGSRGTSSDRPSISLILGCLKHQGGSCSSAQHWEAPQAMLCYFATSQELSLETELASLWLANVHLFCI